MRAALEAVVNKDLYYLAYGNIYRRGVDDAGGQ